MIYDNCRPCLWFVSLWINDSLTDGHTGVPKGPLGVPQGRVLSLLLYSPTHSSNTFLESADDMSLAGLISNNNQTAYREEVLTLSA